MAKNGQKRSYKGHLQKDIRILTVFTRICFSEIMISLCIFFSFSRFSVSVSCLCILEKVFWSPFGHMLKLEWFYKLLYDADSTQKVFAYIEI